MKECSQTLCFRLSCNCSQEEEPTRTLQQEDNHQIESIYSKFAQTLEIQLRNQYEKYSSQIDGLNTEVFGLKNTILRLEMRNKKDNEALNQLRKQYNLLLLKVKDQEPKVIKQIEVVQKLKEVRVQVESEGLKAEVREWKKKADDSKIGYQKMKMERDLLEDERDSLREEIKKLCKDISNFSSMLGEKVNVLEEKDKMIEKLNTHIVFLKNNKEVVLETKYLFPEFKSSDRVRTETKVQTIFVEKPIEKLVFVNVEKRVKQFIQPERPIVNRIITCQNEKACRCEDQESNSQIFRSDIANMQTYINQLQENITSYKSQRQQLVDVIGSKNSELHHLESKMRLYGGDGGSNRNCGNSTVNVTVTRTKQAKPTSQKTQTKIEKYSIKK